MVRESAQVGRNQMIDDPQRETWVEMIEYFNELMNQNRDFCYQDFCALVVKPVSESIYARHFFASQSLAYLIISTKKEWPDRLLAPHILINPYLIEKTVEIQFFDAPVNRGDRGKCKTQVSCSYQDAWSQLEKVLAEMIVYSDFKTESK
jgi:hypothetical protein